MNRKIIFSIIAVVVILLGSYFLMNYLSGKKKSPPVKPTEETKYFVKAKPVAYKINEARVISTGRLASNASVELSSEAQGKLLAGNIPLKKGQAFKKGQLIAKIYNDNLLFSLQSRKSSLLTAIVNILPDMKIDYPGSYPVWLSFFESIDMEKDLPELPEFNSPKEKIFLASRGVLSEYYSIRAEEERLRRYNIYAPFDGTFTEVYLEVGAVANPGSRLATIIRTDKMELEVPVNYYDIKWLKKGDKVDVFAETGNNQWLGYISRISGFVDPQTQSVSVFVAINNITENPVLQGQYLRAEFEGKMVEGSMLIPRNAVFNRNVVFTINDNRLLKQNVIIHHIGQNDLIMSGLEEGIELVVEPLLNATDNTLVEIIR